MSKNHKRLKIEKTTPGYWKVTLHNPPINLYDPEMFAELRVLIDQIEEDKDIKVVVFDSADPDYLTSCEEEKLCPMCRARRLLASGPPSSRAWLNRASLVSPK